MSHDGNYEMRAETELQAKQIKDITERLNLLERTVRNLSSDSDRTQDLHKQVKEEIEELSATVKELKSLITNFSEAKEDMEEKREEVIRLEERVSSLTEQVRQTAETVKELVTAQKETTNNINKLVLESSKNTSVIATLQKIAWILLSSVVLMVFNTWLGEPFLAILKAIKAVFIGG